jgi:hypothetical protein
MKRLRVVKQPSLFPQAFTLGADRAVSPMVRHAFDLADRSGGCHWMDDVVA